MPADEPYSDERIEAALAALRPITYETVPIEGVWRVPPFERRELNGRTVVVLSVDPDISEVVLDRDTGEVLLVDGGGDAVGVNASLAHLVACAHAYRAAAVEAGQVTGDDAALTAVAGRALAMFGSIDPSAVRRENQLWPAAAEELGYGL